MCQGNCTVVTERQRVKLFQAAKSKSGDLVKNKNKNPLLSLWVHRIKNVRLLSPNTYCWQKAHKNFVFVIARSKNHWQN